MVNVCSGYSCMQLVLLVVSSAMLSMQGAVTAASHGLDSRRLDLCQSLTVLQCPVVVFCLDHFIV